VHHYIADLSLATTVTYFFYCATHIQTAEGLRLAMSRSLSLADKRPNQSSGSHRQLQQL